VIPKDSEFFKLLLQVLTESAVISRIVGSNAKQFVSDVVMAQNFQDNIGHVLAGVMVTEAFEC
jgi:chemotaxis regulatin CheY-phosphate phosphatase CheZ